jgi:hypothetical protein
MNFFPLHGFKEFYLVVSVGHYKFQLNEHSMGIILQAMIGGVATDFRPQQMSYRVFKFIVASCNVGFHFFNLKSFSCEQYKVFFHLYGNGGPHWMSEYKKFIDEEEASWLLVTNRKANSSLRFSGSSWSKL